MNIKVDEHASINYEAKKAFVFSLYKGFGWVDVKPLKWKNIEAYGLLKITQGKMGEILDLLLHPVALKKICEKRKEGLLFKLPTADGANRLFAKCCDDEVLDRHITWHCARHIF